MSGPLEAWVVYDSVHGNTRAVAEAIAEGLRSAGPVQVVAAGDADPSRLRRARLVVLGCPTHAFSLSPGMKAFVGTLFRGALEGVPFATFDTRFALADMPSPVLKIIVPLVGKRAWAATHLARAAARAGAARLVDPEGFFVRETEGPLADGEIERATAWGRTLSRLGAQRTVPAAPPRVGAAPPSRTT